MCVHMHVSAQSGAQVQAGTPWTAVQVVPCMRAPPEVRCTELRAQGEGHLFLSCPIGEWRPLAVVRGGSLGSQVPLHDNMDAASGEPGFFSVPWFPPQKHKLVRLPPFLNHQGGQGMAHHRSRTALDIATYPTGRQAGQVSASACAAPSECKAGLLLVCHTWKAEELDVAPLNLNLLGCGLRSPARAARKGPHPRG